MSVINTVDLDIMNTLNIYVGKAFLLFNVLVLSAFAWKYNCVSSAYVAVTWDCFIVTGQPFCICLSLSVFHIRK